MRHPLAKVAFVLALAGNASVALAGGIYAQIVATFDKPRPYSQTYDKSEHALVLEFQKTSPNELTAFESYDERLVRRVVIKDLSPAGTQVKMVLRDRDVRALVKDFTEPPRVVVDLFDADYEEEHDPTTGMPLVASPSAAEEPDVGPPTGAKGKLVGADNADAWTAAPSPAGNGKAAKGSKKKLLIPSPGALLANPEGLTEALRSVEGGPGKAWHDYPRYVYRLRNALATEGPATGTSETGKALSSAAAMAEYASKLFDAGQDGKALVAYQQVLHQDPTIFDRDALHLWKFAETHLGQGNLTLARGYYEALIEKFPASPLSSFAALRRLDIDSIQMAHEGKQAEWPKLLAPLATIKTRHHGELEALIAVRRGFWSQQASSELWSKTPKFDRDALPPVDATQAGALATVATQVENRPTGFIASSLALAQMLRPDTPWEAPIGQFAESYFKAFSGDAAEPWRSQLLEAAQTKIRASLIAKVEAGKLVDAISDFASLPPALAKAAGEPKTAWALGEAYRKLAQTPKAVEMYAIAAKGEDGPDRFKAQFWLSLTAGDAARQASAATRERFAKQSRDADRDAAATWGRMKEEERDRLAVALQAPLEAAVKSPVHLRTPALIVLDSWGKRFGTRAEAAATAGGKPDWDKSFSPSGGAVLLLSDLGKRFGELGMTKERRQAINLLAQMRPAQLGDDKAAKKIWTSQVIGLADDLRRADQYLDAGRMYATAGDGAENFEGRAESLYKGGLLLYRAGRREEAVAAFKKAADDGNNQFYANLAKERLAQLE